jgi:hypothetical protein
LKREMAEFARENDINSEQLGIANEAMDKFVAKRKAIKEVREKYPDDRELFRALYGKYPEGEIRIDVETAMLSVICYDLRDYGYIHSKGWKNPGSLPKDKNLERANLSRGVTNVSCLIPELSDAISIQNAQGRNEAQISHVNTHEERHIINGLLERKEPIGNYITANEVAEKLRKGATEEEIEKIFIKGCRFERRTGERRARDEILAYLKDGTDLDIIEGTLKEKESEGGIYDFLAKYTKPEFVDEVVERYGEKHKDTIAWAARKVFINEYHELIEKSLDAFRRLKDEGGYPHSQAIEILSQEPLGRWAKVTERILKAKGSIRSRQEKQKQAELEKSQAEAIVENKARDTEKNPTPDPQKEDPAYKPDNELEEDLAGF